MEVALLVALLAAPTFRAFLTDAVVAMTETMPCTCHNEFQDTLLGAGKRAFTFGPDVHNHQPGWRCTGCQATREGKLDKSGKTK
jgi:hypothetical protein